MRVSIIIPHHNIPHLLRRCLDSIPRDNPDVETIVVDDASDDEEVASVNSWKAQYPNSVFVFDKTGKGAGHARNIGLEKASGDWIIFADADDFFDKRFWNVLFPIFGSGGGNSSDIIYFKTKGIDSDTFEPTMRGVVANKLVDDYISRKKYAEEKLKYCHIIPWGKVFRHQFLEESHIRFEEIPVGNDVLFGTQTGHKAQRVEAKDVLMYYITYRKGSLTQIQTSPSLRCRFDVRIRQHQYLVKIGKPQYAMDLIRYGLQYILPVSFRDWLWTLGEMIRNRINPFIGLYKVPYYLRSLM